MALLAVLFAYGGWEDALVPSGEVKEPRRVLPFALAALSAGSMTVVYAGICGALIHLRRKQPAADALRIPFGTIVAIVGIALCAVLLTQLGVRHALLMLLTASLAAANGLWATHQTRHGRWRASVQL